MELEYEITYLREIVQKLKQDLEILKSENSQLQDKITLLRSNRGVIEVSFKDETTSLTPHHDIEYL